ncbi:MULTISPECIES: LPS translocon maturation chaperone LptM [Pseudomonas]|jgi:predicted small lipoprotein YifL|uniref:Lipoprotein n=1 Tax=Serpens gallinarum TaxID=2763075 RepID=A0ABR8TK78_9PSED|nr:MULTISPECIES: lipoprotein [Pseudomonas]MBD7975704.1 lipoprotein [Serpens gallinarum]MBF0675028.1 lipoprotein [Pseudomonas sp.]
MKRLLLPLLALFVLSVGLSACGQKGPLYHPDDESAGHSKDRFEF